MPQFSKLSRERLSSCHEALQKLFTEVIKTHDCTVVCGHRGRKEQNAAFEQGKSQLKFPLSKHNKVPSLAVDVAPFIDGKLSWDVEEHIKFGKFVLEKARELNIPLRWGGDFDQDGDYRDKEFKDYPHYELI